ncbi:hypothetical protein Cpir12675_001319 [Ceratocystis pirilliformis]|uniref:Uncharacterized protein n=1 Tax=Ceratocystis pirilliformis TaxID=259994 RepID=A0ABR3ZFZ9_9PEZI
MSSLGLIGTIKNERLLLFGMTAYAVTMVGVMWSMLNSVKEDSVLEPIQVKTQYITQETEDALQLHTIEKLADHPNYSIRDISLKILSDRAVEDGNTLKILIVGVTKRNYETRLRCLQSLALIITNTYGSQNPLKKLYNQRSYDAFVRCLELSLEDSVIPKLDNSTWDEHNLRDETEKLALSFLYELTTPENIHLLLQSKFIKKWLVKQNWGDSDEERQKNFHEYTNKRNRVADIIRCLQKTVSGMDALRRAGLVPFQTNNEMDIVPGLQSCASCKSHWDDMCAMDCRSRDRIVHSRVREQSEEEVRLRRQNREAMVFNDGTRPIGREDIIERRRDDSE